jgi:hypothetical protein
MKVIEITVADDLVATIVGLLAGECAELHIRPAAAEKHNGAASKRHHGATKLADQLLEVIGSRTVSGSDLNRYFKTKGYNESSACSCASKLVQQGILERLGGRHDGRFRRKLAVAS